MLDKTMLEYFHLAYSATGAVSISLNFLLLLLIVFDSPKKMGNYKWFLANQALSDLAMAVYMDVIYRPVIIVGPKVILTIGHLKYLGSACATLGILILAFLATWSILSLAICFVSRYAHFTSIDFCKSVNTFRGFIILLVQVACVSFLSALGIWTTSENDLQALLNYTLTIEPGLHEIIDPVVLAGSVMKRSNLEMLATPGTTAEQTVQTLAFCLEWIALLYLIVICPVTCFICSYLTNASFKKFKNSMTPAAYKMQRQLLITLIVQCAYPLVVFVVPLIMATTYVFKGWTIVDPNNKWVPFIFTLAVLNFVVFNAVSTFIFTNIYRHALMRRLRRLFIWKRATVLSKRGEEQ